MPKSKCKAITKTGERCRVAAGADGYCTFHSPARAELQAEARKRGGNTAPVKVLKIEGGTTLETAAEVRELLGKVILEVFNATIRGDLYRKARTVGYLCGIMLKAFEVTELERRITELEKGVDL